MNTRLTVIVDNTPQDTLRGEWGLSILVEHRGKQILADVGASQLFAVNLQRLGFDIRAIDYATLSHAHYDHANGMARFFRDNTTAPFYLRAGTGENCYKKLLFFQKYIGIPRHVLRDHADRIVLAGGDYSLCDGAWLIPHKTPGLAQQGLRENMYQRQGMRFVPDDFSHEQSLVLETEKGLVIINCCSHGGAANIIREVAETFPRKPVYGLIGGFHLYNKTEAEVRALAQQIKETGIRYVCTGHCTGARAYSILKEELGDTLEQLHVGKVMDF